MGRVYSAQFSNVAVTAAQDLFSLIPATNKPISVHAVYISQNTEVADAAEEGLTISLANGFTTAGSGGTGPLVIPLNFHDAAAGATANANDTTPANTGTQAIKHTEVWNVRMPFIYLPAPEDRIPTIAGSVFQVWLVTTPADSITMSGTIVFEELV